MLGHVREQSQDWRVCVELCRHTPAVFDHGWLEVGPASQMCERYLPPADVKSDGKKRGGALSQFGWGLTPF